MHLTKGRETFVEVWRRRRKHRSTFSPSFRGCHWQRKQAVSQATNDSDTHFNLARDRELRIDIFEIRMQRAQRT
jgi:hypothetical protein